jgi:intracellular sulfur oxidation DsrE/DsrF family protein
MTLAHTLGTLVSAACILASTATFASEPLFPAVTGYGGIHPLAIAAEQPDKKLRYKVVFSITREAPDAGKPNPGLEKVARMLNLLAHNGIKPKQGDVVAIVHGPATALILSDAHYEKKYHTVNPNLALIAQLKTAGAEVHVCHEAMYAMNIEPVDIDPDVQIDVSALTTLATLQLRGYALIPD